jgi:hypothetical protein
MYASIRRYKVSSVDEVVRRASEGFVPLISQGPGFMAYYIVDAGEGVVASISLFETQAGAEESNRMAADWVKENIAPLVSGPPEITAGEVRVHKAA